MSSLKDLYVILDQNVAGAPPLTSVAQNAIKAGARIFQYREKNLPKKIMYQTAIDLRAITTEANATFIINDSVDIALAVKADGVHLGQNDLPLEDARKILGPDRIIGISTHSITQAIAAEDGGANYIGFGPIYSTKTKHLTITPLGPQMAAKVCSKVSIPVFGIGGINFTNVAELLSIGMAGIAVLSTILHASNVESAVNKLQDCWKNSASQNHFKN